MAATLTPVSDGHMRTLQFTSNRARSARLEIHEAMRRGELCPVELVRDPPALIAHRTVLDFLKHVPGIGPVKLRMLNARGGVATPAVNLLAPLGELSDRQREWLILHALTPSSAPARQALY